MTSEPVGVIVSLLTDNWTAGNTNSITPTIGKIYDYQRLDFTATSTKTYVLMMHLNPRTSEYNGSGKASKELESSVKIDIRTMVSEAHAWNCLKEVERILEDAIIQPESTYDELYAFGDVEILHDRYKGLFHIQKNCVLKDSNTTTG